MARLIPNYIHEGAPPGERELFAKFRDQLTPHDWLIMHSLNLPRHLRRNAGEIDFLVLIPGKGIVVLEVKSHETVEFQNGYWKLGNHEPDPRGPFKQASEAMYSLVHDLPEKLTRGIPFTFAVAFTHVRFRERATEWHPWQVLDSESLKPNVLASSILKVVNENRDRLVADLDNPEKRRAVAWFRPDKGEPTTQQIEQISEHLRPNFEIHVRPEDMDDKRQEEHKKFLKEQFEALDAMELSPRTLFEGPAGTGKTLLAVEAARRALSEEGRVLVLCFNRLLAGFLMGELPRNLRDVGTIHRFASGVLGKEPRSDFGSSAYFDEATKRLVAEGTLRNTFSTIVVDEIQDINSIGALPFLAEVIRQNPEAKIRLFGDLENQDIQFRRDHGVQDASNTRQMIRSAISDLVLYSLRKNCRNRPGVGEVVVAVTGLKNLYSGFRLPSNSPNFDIKVAQNPVPTAIITEVIDGLLRSFIPGSIAVLSGGSHLSLNELSPAHQKIFTDDDSSWSLERRTKPNTEQKGLLSTIRKFKGMDAQAVVLINLPADLDVSFLYTGISRAIERVSIICPNDMLKIIMTRMSG
jgi:DNA polymerase III delta prime subunit